MGKPVPLSPLREKLGETLEIPYQPGALYSRTKEIHALLGGQRQGGISTPKDRPVVIIFTGEAGKAHGYTDHWENEEEFHYFGEGQSGDMTYTGGNRAILRHDVEGKKLLLFKAMGHGQPYRYEGEFRFTATYQKPGVPDSQGNLRTAIVFQLKPVNDLYTVKAEIAAPTLGELSIGSTAVLQLVEVRKKQSLFKKRLMGIEKECRLTRVRDLRFLRASHIKPWALCATGDERVDGNNGLLLTPDADLLFDNGWITFQDGGRVEISGSLPRDVTNRLGFKFNNRSSGTFSEKQRSYLEFHRNKVFEKKFKRNEDPVAELLRVMTPLV